MVVLSFFLLIEDQWVVRLRGLPYSCTKEKIQEFFDGVEILRDGIVLLHDRKRFDV